MPDYDLIVVPGGGVREGGQLPPWVTTRFDAALQAVGDAHILALSAGTPHRKDTQLLESVAGARYLINQGFDPARILVETNSYDTIGNAYFARVIHIVPGDFRRLLVITSLFHAARTETAFRWIMALEPAWKCRLDFLAVPDAGMSSDAQEARRMKEGKGLENLAGLTASIQTLRSFHRWLFTEHQAYALGAKPAPEQVDPRATETY
jgi:hypothetical protein